MGGISAAWRARQLRTFWAVYTSEIKGPVVTLALRTNPVVKVSRKGSGFHFPSTLILLHQEEKNTLLPLSLNLLSSSNLTGAVS